MSNIHITSIFIIFIIVIYIRERNVQNISRIINKTFQSNYRSQFNQDIVLYYKYFYNVTDGFFLEVGAYDGVTISNSYLFEKNLNWKGILIEGGSSNCRKLIRNSAKRKNAIIICSPICLSNFTYFNEAGTVGKIAENNNLKKRIKCKTLKSITDYYKVKHINLFSLDVEGSELDVIRTFDFNVTVSFWLIEWPHLNEDTKNKIIEILNTHNYIKRNEYISEADVLFSLNNIL